MVGVAQRKRQTRTRTLGRFDFRLVSLLCVCSFVAWRQFEPSHQGSLPEVFSLSSRLFAVQQTSPPFVSCPDIYDRVRRGNLSDPNGGVLHARYTKDEPHFWISVHDSTYDPVRFLILKRGEYYETKLSQAFTEILTTYNNPNHRRVIDVGGNIGWFSLLSAALGFDVDAFEPNEFNHIRTCESLCLNQWTDCSTTSTTVGKGLGNLNGGMNHGNVRIFPYGVSEKEGDFFFRDDSNPGRGIVSRHAGNSTKRVRMVTLDSMGKQLGWFDTDIAILKVDVEGFELEVLRSGKELLRSNRVQNIFMEATVGSQEKEKRLKPVITLLAEAGYKVYKSGGYMGPQDTNVPPMDASITESLVYHCKGGNGGKRTQCNLWWKLARP